MSRFVLVLILAAAFFACSVYASEATTDGEGIVLSEAYISCENDEVHYGPMCAANCPSGSHELIGKHCMYKVPKRTSVGSVPKYCAPEKLALFYADKVYEVTDANIMKKFPESSNELLMNCGTFQIINEFHYEKTLSLINIHVTIAINPTTGVAVVSFRGTEMGLSRLQQTTVNWLSNFAVARNDYPYAPNCGSVHSGFLKNFDIIEQQLTEQIKRLLEAKYYIIFTGHSYGGALSILSGIRYAHAFPSFKSAMRVISIAAPRVGNQQFADCYSRVMNVADTKSGNSVLHYITKAIGGSEDGVTNSPPKMIGFADTPGKRQWVTCLEEFTSWSVDAAKCHIRDAYIKGMLSGQVSNVPLDDSDIEALSDDIAEFVLSQTN